MSHVKSKPDVALERNSDRSLYQQITDSLRLRLITHTPAGGRIPTEAELTEHFAVSRSTVRKAIQQLVDEGILVRRQGKGTFLVRSVPTIVHSIDRLGPFMETFKKVGEDIETRITRFEWVQNVTLPKVVSAWGRPILIYERLYVSRGVPHAITQVHLPFEIGRRLSMEEAQQHAIYDALAHNLHVQPMHAEFRVSCRQTSARISKQLELAQSALLLTLERTSYDKNGVPIEYTTHFLRPDVYQLSVVLDDLPSRRK